EGFIEKKSPEIGDVCCLAKHHRAPPHEHRDRYRARRATAKRLQTDLLPGSSEPPPGTEGSRFSGRLKHRKSLEKQTFGDRAGCGRNSRGQVLGTGDSSLGAVRLRKWVASPAS